MHTTDLYPYKKTEAVQPANGVENCIELWVVHENRASSSLKEQE